MHPTVSMRDRTTRLGLAVGATLVVMAALAVPAAFANTANPTTFNATETINGNGTATVTISGNWDWPSGQKCIGRYGTGWEVGWWGIGATNTPANNFTLSNVSIITSSDQGENGVATATGSQTATDSIQFPGGGPFANQFFYVGDNYNGSEIFTQSFCNAAQPPDGNNTNAFDGTYTATATYPNTADVPALLCVVGYDEHGSLGNPTVDPGKTLNNDYSPGGDGDNSIQKNQFIASGNCGTIGNITTLPSVGVLSGIVLAVLGAMALTYFQIRRYRRRRATGFAA